MTEMLFSEVYSAYFNVMTAIITEALNTEISEKRIREMIAEKAFSESILTILPAIKNEEWLIMNKKFQTPIKRPPVTPLTILQKRWLKSLLTDPRIALFAPSVSGLEDVRPLFTREDFVYFDRYTDGDPFQDATYIAHFQTILVSLKTKCTLYIEYVNRHGKMQYGRFIPYRMEYSSKDDKFRLATVGTQYVAYINLARMMKCELLEPYSRDEFVPPRRRECCVTFILQDERNALDRVLLHFSDCRKETRRMESHVYQVDLWYEAEDETEMLIRLLSFGPMLKVIAPTTFIQLIQSRIKLQKELNH